MAHPKRIQRMLKKYGLSGVNKPKRTPSHKTKAAVVLAHFNGKYKLIRFGQQGANQVSGKPRNDSERARRRYFRARHRRNINKGKSSAAYWANKFLWS